MGVFKKNRKASKYAPPSLVTWPFWANWCALDPVGYWIFFENKPELTEKGWQPVGHKWGEPRESIGNISGAWHTLLFSSQQASE